MPTFIDRGAAAPTRDRNPSLWRQRYRDRQELARWTESDLHDIGVSWSDIAHELEKPFWRA